MNERDRKVIIKIIHVTNEQVMFRCVFEDSEYHVDDMPIHSFDLVNMCHIDAADKLVKEISRSAWMLAGRQEIVETMKNKPISKVDLKSLENSEHTMSLGEIYDDGNSCIRTPRQILEITSDWDSQENE